MTMLDHQKRKLDKAVTATKGPFFRIAIPAIRLRAKSAPVKSMSASDTRITKDEIVHLFDADLQKL